MEVLSELIQSSATLETASSSPARFSEWWARLQAASRFAVEKIGFADLRDWSFDERGWIVHVSGKYFSVRGIDVLTDHGSTAAWSQPIIVQPEVGLLGIVTQRREGVLHFLMQAKMEPGNVNRLQLSPTVQATRSNYTQVHGGTLPPYLDLFTQPAIGTVMVDLLGSEQGARFFRKRNRNVVLRLPDAASVPLLDNFAWLTLGQIRQLMGEDNVVNMNTRSVLASVQPGPAENRIPPPEALHVAAQSTWWGPFEQELFTSLLPGDAYASSDEVTRWFTALRSRTNLSVRFRPLDQLEGWQVGSHTISHVEGRHFEIIAVHAELDQREVRSWTQPMIQQREPGIIGLVIRKILGRYHLLVQAKMEVGSFGGLAIAPTVQGLMGADTPRVDEVPFLDLFETGRGVVRFDAMLSEEGGRFFQVENRYIVLEVGDEFPVEVPARFMWMTFRQAKQFIKSNHFNDELRSLIACISPL
jgi:oxidase EvaA